MTTDIQTAGKASIIERVMMVGDLSKLTADERVSYYMSVCQSLGLNPLTRPFEYITLQGKLVMYARKDATEQLRKINGVSIDKPVLQFDEGLVVASVTATDASGRSDSEVGAVNIEGLRGDARANAIMKAVTKAKRRVTLSICGLGMLDETEVETIPDAKPVRVTDTGTIEPPTLDALKDALAKVGNEANVQHTIASDRGQAVLASKLLTAIEDARAIFKKNGKATATEIETATANLRALIAEAKAQPEAATA